MFLVVLFFFFQAEDGIRGLVRSRGLGDVYKRQVHEVAALDLEPGVHVDLRALDRDGHDVMRGGVRLSLIHI